MYIINKSQWSVFNAPNVRGYAQCGSSRLQSIQPKRNLPASDALRISPTPLLAIPLVMQSAYYSAFILISIKSQILHNVGFNIFNIVMSGEHVVL